MNTRMVIDTSVLIGALIGALIGKKGPGREVLRRCLSGEYKPVISNALFQECEDVSRRSDILARCPLDEDEIKALLNAYYSVCHWVPVYYLWRPNLRDENDNFLIELAMASGSKLIVTNNIKDLAGAELRFDELIIVTPEKLLRGK